MGELADLCAVPATVQLNGKEYRLSPLRIGDFARVETVLEGMPLSVIREHIDGLPKDDRQFLIEKAYQDSRPGKINILGPEGQSFMTSVRGLIELIHCSISRYDKDVTKADIANAAGLEEFNEVVKRLFEISGLEVKDVNPTTMRTSEK
jgi:hypothetical protein